VYFPFVGGLVGGEPGRRWRQSPFKREHGRAKRKEGGGGGLGSTTSTWREEGVGVRPSTLGRRVAGSSPKPAGALGGGNRGKIKAGWRSHVDMRAPATVPGLIPVKPGQNHSNKIEFKF
jgi:hypothetical protein